MRQRQRQRTDDELHRQIRWTAFGAHRAGPGTPEWPVGLPNGRIMTPGARVQAAIEVLSTVLGGAPAERALTGWARTSRYAGSKDRAAVRDHVFDALRRLRSAAWAGGQGNVALDAMDPRAVMAGLLAGLGIDPATLFTGEGYAPEPLAVRPSLEGSIPDAVALDVQDWLLPRFRAALGADCDAVLAAMRDRAPVDIRVNLARIDRATMVVRMAPYGALPLDLSPSAIRLDGAPRGLTDLSDFAEGLFEMQDAGSQAVVDRLPLVEGDRILDLCAGGGGKTLAMAMRARAELFAHDADPGRMRDLPGRAARADAEVRITSRPEDAAPYDGILLDVPCSGSGSWRRAPEAKWRLTEARLRELNGMQDAILARAVAMTRPGGWVAYVTCSMLEEENAMRVDPFLDAHPRLRLDSRWSSTPLDGCDGFHLSLLRIAQ